MEFLLKYNLFRICKYVYICRYAMGQSTIENEKQGFGSITQICIHFLKISFLWEIIFKRNLFNCQHFLCLKSLQMVRKTENKYCIYFFVIFRQVSNHTVIKADILKLNFFHLFYVVIQLREIQIQFQFCLMSILIIKTSVKYQLILKRVVT